jgi:outer membrane protein assembly factor BamD (BamD/ComL family)
MQRTTRYALLALLLAGACVGPAAVTRQAKYKMPEPEQVSDEAERAMMQDARRHARLGDAATESGNSDQARAEYRAAGQAFGEVAAKFPSSEYRLVYRTYSGRFLIQSQAFEEAAAVLDLLANDPSADAETRVQASRFRASAAQGLAAAEARQGKVEQLRILSAAQRRGQEPKPQPVPDAWRRVVNATDAYLQVWKQDTDPSAREAAAALAMQAAQIQYSFDNMEDAARRFAAVVEAFPDSSHWADAVRLLLQTYLVRRDEAGYAAALERSTAAAAAESKRLADAAKSGDAEARARADGVARLDEELQKQRKGLAFSRGTALLGEAQKLDARAREAAAGERAPLEKAARDKAIEAAATFERFAEENRDHPDAPNALFNGAIAWSQARDPKRALAARQGLLSRYPEAPIAPRALLASATDLSAAGDHGGAAGRYAQYLEKWPAGEDRCLALQNVGAELDAAGKTLDAARRYLVFGNDGKCIRDDSNQAARALYRAAAIFAKAKRPAEGKEALRALVGLAGVTDPVARSYVEDARARLK